MRPLNYAILKYFTTVEEACPADVYEVIKEDYGNYRMCKPNKVKAAIMTAEKNFLLTESRYDLDESGEVRIYYKAEGEGLDAINNFIK